MNGQEITGPSPTMMRKQDQRLEKKVNRLSMLPKRPTKRTARGGTCGYRPNEIMRCRRRTRTLVQLERTEGPAMDKNNVIVVERWQFRCVTHQQERYI